MGVQYSLVQCCFSQRNCVKLHQHLFGHGKPLRSYIYIYTYIYIYIYIYPSKVWHTYICVYIHMYIYIRHMIQHQYLLLCSSNHWHLSLPRGSTPSGSSTSPVDGAETFHQKAPQRAERLAAFGAAFATTPAVKQTMVMYMLYIW